MPKERSKADSYREKAPIKREKSDAFIDSSEREVSRPKVKAYEGDSKAMNNLGVCYERGTGVKVSLELVCLKYCPLLSAGTCFGRMSITQYGFSSGFGGHGSRQKDIKYTGATSLMTAATEAGKTYESSKSDECALMISTKEAVTVSQPNISKTGDYDGGDRGSGKVTVEGGSYTSSGKGSPVIYSTADITVSDAVLTSIMSEGAVIEGKETSIGQ